MLKKNGDFLVRENVRTRGQYVLSSMQQAGHCGRPSTDAAQGAPKHLLLVDPAGRVRTKARRCLLWRRDAAQDMAFDSVSHLINYHIRARIPIISRGRQARAARGPW